MSERAIASLISKPFGDVCHNPAHCLELDSPLDDLMPGIPEDYNLSLSRRGFQLRDQIGCGLSGRVFRAQQTRLSRDVAVKFFDNTFSRKNPALEKRFRREALLLAKVRHPSIPYVLTAGETRAGVPYTVMEFVAGRPLVDILEKQGKLEAVIAVRYASQILGALEEVHQKRVVHRDVKPANILVSAGRCTLIDFSIGMSEAIEPGLTRATESGERLGSTDYMAPEQADAKTVDHRCDLYAVGIVLFEMLTGHTKFRQGKVDSQLPEIALPLREIVATGCAQHRKDRFQSARAFGEALGPFLAPAGQPHEPRTAVCTNTNCPGADWTSRGYYRGPAIVPDCTDFYCGRCGQELVRGCPQCGREFQDTEFCGSCGSRFYEIPTCKGCGSWLLQTDMDKDTAGEGCSKCIQTMQSAGEPTDDDIPF